MPRSFAALREYLDGEGFLEVETPILQPIYGGAAARPFVTHHNQLHQDLYLRISFELYLKRLIVGGFDRVYEIGRDFRNEGVSFKHNPEFTQLEFYEAYADYQDVMRRTEEMIAYAAQKVMGGYMITWQGRDIDLRPPWRRIPLRQAILDATGIDYEAYPDAAVLGGRDAQPRSRAGSQEQLGQTGRQPDGQVCRAEPGPADVSDRLPARCEPPGQGFARTMRARWSALKALLPVWKCATPLAS